MIMILFMSLLQMQPEPRRECETVGSCFIGSYRLPGPTCTGKDFVKKSLKGKIKLPDSVTVPSKDEIKEILKSNE